MYNGESTVYVSSLKFALLKYLFAPSSVSFVLGVIVGQALV